MKNLIIILARKNSKRLKNKNLLKINKKSLIERCISFAKRVPHSKIIVSSDSQKMVDIALNLGVLAPWLRPARFAKDNSSSESATLHALKWCEKQFGKFESLLLLQPSTPFRSLKILRSALKLFKKNKGRKNYLSVVKSLRGSKHIYGGNKNENGEINLKKIKKKGCYSENNFSPNGSFYIISPNEIKKTKSFFTKNSIGIQLFKKKEIIDIDTLEDLKLARRFK